MSKEVPLFIVWSKFKFLTYLTILNLTVVTEKNKKKHLNKFIKNKSTLLHIRTTYTNYQPAITNLCFVW